MLLLVGHIHHVILVKIRRLDSHIFQNLVLLVSRQISPQSQIRAVVLRDGDLISLLLLGAFALLCHLFGLRSQLLCPYCCR